VKKVEYNDVLSSANNVVYGVGLAVLGYGLYRGVNKLISLYKGVDKYLQSTLVNMNTLMKKIATMSIDKFMDVRNIDSILDNIDTGLVSLKYVTKNFTRIQEEFEEESVKMDINLSLVSYDEIKKISDNLKNLHEFFSDLRLIVKEPGVDMIDIRDKYYDGLKRATHIYKLLNILLLSNARVLEILENAENSDAENKRMTVRSTRKNRR
jgi:hypothetical protein